MKLSNKFTLSRVIFAPIFFFLYNIPLWMPSVPLLSKVSAIVLIPLLVLFELTDYFDGHYARKNGEVSDFGKLFDPFADVMLNLSVFLCAVSSAYMPVVLFVLIFYREFSQNFLRTVAISKGTAVAAKKGGKFKTVFYIFSAFSFLAVECARRLGVVGLGTVMRAARATLVVLFSLCALFSYVSFIDYIKSFAPVFRGKSDEEERDGFRT